MKLRPNDLKKARLDLCLSQEAVAADVGCSAAYISQLERGKKTPSRDVVDKLMEVLAIAPDSMKSCGCGVVINRSDDRCWACKMEGRAQAWRKGQIRVF